MVVLLITEYMQIRPPRPPLSWTIGKSMS
jgi:hypothetical protein